MIGDFSVEYEWLESDAGLSVDSVTAASISIRVGNACLTRLHDRRSRVVRDTIRVSAYRLAVWLLDNWWRLRYEITGSSTDWRLSHCLVSAGGGYSWPDLTVTGDWDVVRCTAQATDPDDVRPIQYLTTTESEFCSASFEREVDRVVNSVIDRLYEHANEPDIIPFYESLRDSWEALREERSTTEQRRWRRLEAMLGFDVDGGPDKDIEEVLLLVERYGERALGELANEFHGQTATVVDQLLSSANETKVTLNMREIDGLRSEKSMETAYKPNVLAWTVAEEQAERVRRLMGISSGPVQNEQLSDLLGIKPDFISAGEDHRELPCSAGVVRDRNGTSVDPVLMSARETSRRFAIARIVADRLIAEHTDAILPLITAKTWRQQFQRAFAQSFLCPAGELVEYIGGGFPDEDAMERAAGYFIVSPLLVQTTLMNKGILPK